MTAIEDIFNATAGSVLDTFLYQAGVAGFRIPIYQRKYDWGKENIRRLFDDVANGIASLTTDEQTLTFLGTVILVKDKGTQEQNFDGSSLSVVDGQQRLTTILLAFCKLLELVQKTFRDCRIEDPAAATWIKEEVEYLIDNLFNCIVGSPSRRQIRTFYQYFPRLVRQGQDERGRDERTAEYRSLIGSYLFDFGRHFYDEKNSAFEFNPRKKDDEYESFIRSLTIVEGCLNEIANSNTGEDSAFPDIEVILSKKGYRSIFHKLGTWDHNKDLMFAAIRKSHSVELKRIIRLLIFGNYLLEKVGLTRVEADDERYAFDIFEALNTTGEPLTAIETFKPRVIECEERTPGGYDKSPSSDYFKDIDLYLDAFRKSEDKQNESKELVVSFALYMTGEKLPKHLSSQRQYLRGQYDSIEGRSPEHTNAMKRRYVQCLRDLVDYKKKFWDSRQIAQQLVGDPDRELILYCLHFLKDINNSLTIPILCRYHTAYMQTSNVETFKGAIKAITAFAVLRRAATGGTQGIDSDYRSIMHKGKASYEPGELERPLKLGLLESTEPPPISTLQDYLQSYLKAKRLGIANRKEWVKLVSRQPLYERSSQLCRFMLLTAAHNAVQDQKHPWLLKKGRTNSQLDYMNHRSWVSEDFESVEHVAPESRGSGWKDDIYESPETKHTLGNLTLLPKGENAAVGNDPWARKKLFYKSFSATTDVELDQYFQEARAKGISFGPKTENYLESHSKCLPVIASVSQVTTWSLKVVEERTRNIAELVWGEIAEWVGMED